MKDRHFSGVGVALVTPFDEQGAIDYAALDTLVEKQIADGVDFMCILGTTAETPTLTTAEREALRRHLVRVIDARVPVLCGCGGNNTAAVCEELRTTDWTGVDAILSVTPAYNKPSQEGLYRHFEAIASASPLPVFLYNVPGRTGVNMTAETTLRLAHDFPNIVAVKEASGNVEQIDEILTHKPQGFSVFSGDDALTKPLVERGAVGVISVVANAYPAVMKTLVTDTLTHRDESAQRLHVQVQDLSRLLFGEGNPSGIKALLASHGLVRNILRFPLVPVSAVTQHHLADFAFLNS